MKCTLLIFLNIVLPNVLVAIFGGKWKVFWRDVRPCLDKVLKSSLINKSTNLKIKIKLRSDLS